MQTTEQQLPVVFIGPNYKPYVIINFEERRQYRNNVGYAYVDMANNKLVFTGTPEDTAYEFDYIKFPPAVTISDELPFPDRFHKKFVYDMATQDSIIQMSNKASELINANRAESQRIYQDMCMWDSKLQII